MREEFAAIATRAGTMPAFVVHPERDGPFAALILYMDIWGVREELYDIARWVAAVGYCCVVPDLYYRQGAIRTEMRDPQGRAISLEKLDAATRAKVLAPLQKFSDEEAMADTAAIFGFLDGRGAVRPGAKGCFGYCLGGRLALRAAARFPETIKAAASFHGTRLASDDADSPHRSAHKIQGELYCGYAEYDPYTPPTTPAQIAAAMHGAAATYSFTLHEGAVHGYALPDRDIYNKQATLRDWENILAMLRRQIPPQ